MAGNRHHQRRFEKGTWELREGARSRIGELRARVRIAKDRALADADIEVRAAAPALADEAFAELQAAEDALSHGSHPGHRPNKHLAVANVHIDAAYGLMLRMAPLADVQALIPGLVALVREQLPVTDERRKRAEEIAREICETPLTSDRRAALVGAVVTAQQALQREKLRALGFVRIVVIVSLGLAVMALAVALLGVWAPDVVPLCFRPEGIGVVCPTGMEPPSDVKDLDEAFGRAVSKWDYPVVEMTGTVAASVAAALSLRHIRGTSAPYNVPVALALLKLPMGALTAVLGLVLMRGDFLPGLSALDSSGQIIAWALIFGYAQQVFTKFVDDQGLAVMNASCGPHARPYAGAGCEPQEAA
ncbi:hypothetical protein [Streptomyces abikoensis]|uniref:hypothetical protein n=1 Tax=Streptomyces abikoensis TaxID=97398 RepID=UPI0016734938|nr:hypothetical protein [Streptomyces abikoensis]GGP54800.1 hypothetical protein GCM10010214_29870 [Streptomyces abikoensis]